METDIFQTRYGQMEVPREGGWIWKSFKELGEWSETEVLTLAWVVRELGKAFPQGVDVVDAGAYCGDLTVPLARVARRVWAFEPQPDLMEILKRNTSHLENVEVFPFGLGHLNQTVTYNPRPEQPGSVMLLPNGGGANLTEIRTLDSLGIDPHLIKMDVEGMELHVILGALETLKRAKPVLFFEHDTAGFEEDQNRIAGVLEGVGYVITHSFVLPVWNQFNWAGNQINPFGEGFCSLMWMALPMEGKAGDVMLAATQEIRG